MIKFHFSFCAAFLFLIGNASAQERNAEDLTCRKEIRDSKPLKPVVSSPANLPIGTVLSSSLHKEHFACLVTGKWVLADGGKIPNASKFALLVRFNLDQYAPLVKGNDILVPDLRGVFIRGKNYGRDAASGNPDGESALGKSQYWENRNGMTLDLTSTAMDGATPTPEARIAEIGGMAKPVARPAIPNQLVPTTSDRKHDRAT